MPEWQPMETAPRDGTTILAHFPVWAGWRTRQDVALVFWCGTPEGGSWRVLGMSADVMASPGCWMELPDPPENGENPT